jgi:hypothetical protein
MMMSLHKLFFLFVAACASPASADTIHVVSHLSGYKCMMLSITAQQAMDPSFHVPVYAQPSQQAQVVGYAALQVAVREPENVVNGFVQALFPTGSTVWILKSELTTYHSLGDSAAKCVPAKMSNGRYGFDYPHG